MARKIILAIADDGAEIRQDVGHGASVLNIEADLLRHLDERPYSDEWLQQLQNYCANRLLARHEARKAGTLLFPQAHNWAGES